MVPAPPFPGKGRGPAGTQVHPQSLAQVQGARGSGHYKASGVVRVDLWEKYFGKDTYTEYDGTHFMEPGYIDTLLIPKIREVLGLEK